MGRRTGEPPISWLMKTALARPNLISLAAGFTDNPSLPVRETLAITREMLGDKDSGEAALQYGTTAGDAGLRRLSAELIRRQDQGAKDWRYSADRALITNGSQQLLYLLTECLCDPGDIVLVEDPTYFVYLGIAQSHGLNCRGVRMQPDGIDLEHLEEILVGLKRNGELRRLKMLYLVTYYQNPSGITSSLEKKRGALELLRRFEKHAGHRIYLLEDAAYRDLRFAGEGIPSALAVRKFADRVIYTSTFSKPFASGVRVGFGVLPEELLSVVLRLKGNHDFGSANFLQQIVARALISGHYDKHLLALRRTYRQKAEAMGAALDEHFPAEIQWAKPEGGLYFWARTPRSLTTGMQSRFFQAALAGGVLYVPGQLCYCDDPSRRKPNHEMRLSFGSASTERIVKGIERLGRVLRKHLN
jgi:2-aminoadipate transaminase